MKKQVAPATVGIVIAIALIVVLFLAWYTFFTPETMPPYFPKPGTPGAAPPMTGLPPGTPGSSVGPAPMPGGKVKASSP